VKKFIMILALFATSAFAEPSFDQIQSLIGQQKYAAAEQGLEQIIKNHPNSAKAYYSMAQAQAGLGNQDKARYALNKATGLDPALSFASASQVRSLEEALTPQVKKIEVIEESHWLRNTFIALLVASGLALLFAWYIRRNEDEDKRDGSFKPVTPVSPTPSPYKEEPFEPVTVKKNTVYKKAETPTPSYTPSYSTPAPAAHTTTVVNNSNDGLLTGMILGNMMSGHHHDHERIIEKEVIREVPVKSYESPGVRTSSRDSDSISSSWDSDSSSSRSSSSSWSSSSSSDSSWSSSDSSSSSWDSGSSSSDSSW
jgi:hypothetical protein